MKKIHTVVIFDMTKNGCPVIEDEFYYYDGPVANCKDSDAGDVFEETVDVFNDAVEDTADFFTPEKPQDFFLAPGLQETLGIKQPIDFFINPALQGAIGIGGPPIDAPSPSPPPPGASPQEINEFNQAIEDFQLLQQGLRKEPAPGGGFFIREIPDAELNESLGERAATQLRSNRAIQLLSGQRTEAALGGTLPVSPAFEKEAGEREAATELSVLRGAGVQSTSGAQRISLQQQTSALLRDAIRRGEITAGQGINLQQQQVGANLQNQILQNFQRGRFAGAQIGQQQQGFDTQLQIAQLLSQVGGRAGTQQLIGTIGGAAIPGLIGLL